ncbi:hypothetical protein UA08_06024 [Talaromyces atroroseus]|uniref:Uncharacterized protein n=1 Tax=Talaromyces atroroseus TaxID=1441469 RepID=A0A225ASX2_TALAT|nr:hypothetical protein UA08_06024 [Talaromyces atroroseus]OKL58699.1 hypothetical protein UA08_06024 [Talaromyces atroroseus]
MFRITSLIILICLFASYLAPHRFISSLTNAFGLENAEWEAARTQNVVETPVHEINLSKQTARCSPDCSAIPKKCCPRPGGSGRKLYEDKPGLVLFLLKILNESPPRELPRPAPRRRANSICLPGLLLIDKPPSVLRGGKHPRNPPYSTSKFLITLLPTGHGLATLATMDYNTSIPIEEERNSKQPPFERQGTPERPPYSPLTPVLAHLAPIPGGATIIPPALDASPALTPAASTATATPTSTTTSHNTPTEPPQNQNAARRNEAGNRRTNPPPPSMGPPQQPITTIIRPEPSPVPISESDNSDVIALRSAISILQLQKQKALHDIKTLDEMKRAAAADPEGFSRELLAEHLTQQGQGSGLVDTDLSLEGTDEPETQEGENDAEEDRKRPKFGTIPKPQNVVRMPPINWAKYQIVGEPLDKMHEEQRNRPFAGVPRQDPNQRAPEHVIAAPYRPLTDKIEGSTKGRMKRDRKAS